MVPTSWQTVEVSQSLWSEARSWLTQTIKSGAWKANPRRDTDTGIVVVDVHFESASSAMMFKLTFGGQA